MVAVMIETARRGPMCKIFMPSGEDRMQVVIALRSRLGSARFLGRGWSGQPGRTLLVGARGEEWRIGAGGGRKRLLGGGEGRAAGFLPLGEG